MTEIVLDVLHCYFSIIRYHCDSDCADVLHWIWLTKSHVKRLLLDRLCLFCLCRGAAIDVKNKKGNSPLWLACNGEHTIFSLLVHDTAVIIYLNTVFRTPDNSTNIVILCFIFFDIYYLEYFDIQIFLVMSVLQKLGM